MQTASWQDMTAEYRTLRAKEPGFLNYNRIEKTNVDIARAICSRDYKGFGTGFEVQNGVVEWKKRK